MCGSSACGIAPGEDSYNGDIPQFYIPASQGQVYTLTRNLLAWLYDPPADPGSPRSWIGPSGGQAAGHECSAANLRSCPR
ncbi:hypothetical protein [Nocardia niwae]|uniref:hypothetical protein n=1 Tax=Nocardia niwae TaxID=626084 RepID=UPI0033E262D2